MEICILLASIYPKKIPREKQNIGRQGGIGMSWMEKVLETTYICVFTGPH